MSALPPNKNTLILINEFISYAQSHLGTVSGLIQTISQYPPPAPPAPGFISWTGYTVAPAGPAPTTPDPAKELYDKIDYTKTDLDKDDPEVKDIVEPDPLLAEANADDYEDEDVAEGVFVEDDFDRREALNAGGQKNNIKADKLNKALTDQGISRVGDPSDISTTYKNLDELLQKAGKCANVLGKSPRVTYANLKSGYNAAVHGLCPQGTQSVVVALTGIDGLGRISGHADWFSFKSPSTGGGTASFAKSIGGKTYYNDKIKINVPSTGGVPNWAASYIGDASQWQIGDIIVMGYTGSKKYGHIQVWTGWAWVSDFTQRRIQRSFVDTDSIALWRLNANGIAAVQSQRV
jgi:hypothetical protein